MNLATINKRKDAVNKEIEKLNGQINKRVGILAELEVKQEGARRDYAAAELDNQPSGTALKKLERMAQELAAGETVITVANERIAECNEELQELAYQGAEAQAAELEAKALPISQELAAALWKVTDLSAELNGIAWQAKTLDENFGVVTGVRVLTFLSESGLRSKLRGLMVNLKNFYPIAYEKGGRVPR